MNLTSIFKLQYLITLLLVSLSWSCASTDPKLEEKEYQTLTPPPNRDLVAAKELNEEAILKIKSGDFEGAELDLKQSLRKDITYGPAHNNLGKVYFKTKRYYLAAWEFEYAIKLMKNRPEPKNNLGLVFEAVGEMDNAISQYQEAHKLEPENHELLGNLVRARRKNGDKSPELKDQFKQLVLIERRPQWLKWAQDQLNIVNWEQATNE